MRVIVVGGGIVGAAAAWRLSERHEVTLVDPEPASAAARVAAGMLAPVTEVHHGEEALLRLNLVGAQQWPAFAAGLRDAAGLDVGYHQCGTVVAARDRDDLARLDDLHDHQRSLGLAVERLSSRELRRLEPALGPSVRGGLWVPGDHQVDPRRVLAALAVASRGAGATVVDDRAVVVGAGSVTLAGGDELGADAVVVAAGWATGPLVGLPVRPVKGQILRLRATGNAVAPTHVVRGLDVYVTPRPDGEVVVGATMEERGADRTVTAGAVHDLLHAAWELLPGLAEAEVVELGAGLRPGSPDNGPIVGEVDGVVVATGHHRNGVLLAPVTADAVVAIVEGHPPDWVSRFSPQRFQPVGVAS